MTLGDKLKELRERAGLSAEKLGFKAEISGSYIRRIEKGERKTVTLETAKRLAQALNVDPREFMDMGSELEELSRSSNELYSQLRDAIIRENISSDVIQEAEEHIESIENEVCFVPVVGAVPCGKLDLRDESDINEYIPMPKEIIKGKQVFAVKATGDSLTGDGISTGDTLIIERNPEIVDGKIYIVCVDSEVTAKHVYRHDGSVCLKSSNPNYPDLFVSRGDIQGRLIASIKLW